MTIRRDLTGNEMDQVTAALRMWQAVQEGRVSLIMPDGNPCGLDYFEDVATNSYQHEALSADEIDTLLADCFLIF